MLVVSEGAKKYFQDVVKFAERKGDLYLEAFWHCMWQCHTFEDDERGRRSGLRVEVHCATALKGLYEVPEAWKYAGYLRRRHFILECGASEASFLFRLYQVSLTGVEEATPCLTGGVFFHEHLEPVKFVNFFERNPWQIHV